MGYRMLIMEKVMPNRMIILRVDGKVEKREIGKVPLLADIQEAVGGFIEHVPYFTRYEGNRCVAFCNEDGKRGSLPVNERATRLWLGQIKFDVVIDDTLVGDVVILQGSRDFLGEL